MIVDAINRFLTEESKDIPQTILDEVGELAKRSFSRQFGKREDKPGTLRLSSIGKCERAQAYKLLNYEEDGKEIDSRAKCTFWNGDQIETLLMMLARSAGLEVKSYGLNQKTVDIEGIEGHPDGILEHNGKDVLVECKSMSSFSFKRFQEENYIDPTYQYQIQAYLYALGLDQCVIVGFNKDAGVFHELIINKDQTIIYDVLRRIRSLKGATQENLPERPYQPDARNFLPWQCRYCNVYKTCWPSSELVLVGKAYRLRVKDVKNGEEVQPMQGTEIDESLL